MTTLDTPPLPPPLDAGPEGPGSGGHDPVTREYLVNPAVSVIRSSADEIIAHLGSRSRSSHRISDGESRGRLADFVTAFATPRAPAAVAATIGLDAETTAEFFEHLTRGQVLIPAEQARYSYLASGLGLAPADLAHEVAVVGTGRVADAVARQLADLLETPVSAGADLVDAFADADLVVVASDRPDPALGYDADEASRATDTPWHLTYLDGFELMVGPTFVPGVSANYYDFDSMDESARVLRMQYLFEKTGRPVVGKTLTVPAFAADLAASWATLAVAQHLWGRGSFLEGYLMRVDLERMQVVRDKVMRLPRNPVDMGVRTDLRHPFL